VLFYKVLVILCYDIDDESGCVLDGEGYKSVYITACTILINLSWWWWWYPSRVWWRSWALVGQYWV